MKKINWFLQTGVLVLILMVVLINQEDSLIWSVSLELIVLIYQLFTLKVINNQYFKYKLYKDWLKWVHWALAIVFLVSLFLLVFFDLKQCIEYSRIVIGIPMLMCYWSSTMIFFKLFQNRRSKFLPNLDI